MGSPWSVASTKDSAAFGIRGKVILLAFLCAVLPSALISVLAIESSRGALERSVRLELAGLAHDQMASLQSALQEGKTNLGTWSTLNTMQNVLIDDVDGVIQNELVKLQRRYNNFADLLVVNPDGKVVAAAREANKGNNLRGADFFDSALHGAGLSE
jgi:hypothetical protein